MNRYYNCQIKHGSLLQKQNIVFKDEEQKKQRSSFLMLMPLVVSSFCTKYNDYCSVLASFTQQLYVRISSSLQNGERRRSVFYFLDMRLLLFLLPLLLKRMRRPTSSVASATTTASFFPSYGQISLTMLDATQIDNRTRINVKCSKNQYSLLKVHQKEKCNYFYYIPVDPQAAIPQISTFVVIG